MSDYLIPGILIVAMISVVLWMIYMLVIVPRKRSEMMSEVANDFNLSYKAGGSWLANQPFGPIFQHWRGTLFSNVVYGATEGCTLFVFDCVMMGAKFRDGAYTAAVAITEGRSFPPFYVLPKKRKREEAALDVGHRAFSAKYDLQPHLSQAEIQTVVEGKSLEGYDDRPDQIRQAITPEMLDAIAQYEGLELRGEGEFLMLKYPGTRRFLGREKVVELINALVTIAAVANARFEVSAK